MIKKLYNPTQAEGGLVNIAATSSGCCGASGTVCQYRVINFSATVTGITFKSAKTNANVTKIIGSYTTNHGLEALLIAALESEGYVAEGTDSVSVVDNASNKDIYITGEAVVSTINATSVTTACTTKSICDYVLTTVGGTAKPFKQNNGTPTNLTFGAAQSAADVKTLIENATTGEESVAVVKNDDNSFTITIVFENNNDFSFNGAPFVRSNCRLTYLV